MTSRSSLDRSLDRARAERDAEQRLRTLRTVHFLDSTHMELDGRRFINFSSNDYLGLSRHPELIEAVQRAAGMGVGSAASPLMTGHTDVHASAETVLAEWKGYEAAVLLPSGYQANHAAVQTLAALGPRASLRARADQQDRGGFTLPPPLPQGRGVRFLVDKLAHASLLDAIRATGAPFRVFPHNHLAKLRRLLEEAAPEQLQVVVTESIFSMDGDAADLEGLAELKRRFDFVLLLDEAHATGTYGPDGSGYASEMGLADVVDVSIVTLSKALGCMGGAVCGSGVFIEALVNYGRSYIYSTSLAPPMAAAVEAAVGIVRREPERRRRVRELARRVRDGVARLRFRTSVGEAVTLREGFSESGRRTLPQPLPEREGGELLSPSGERLGEGEGLSAGAVHPPPAPPSREGGNALSSSIEITWDSPIIPIVLGSEAAAVEAEGVLRELGLLVVAVRPPTVPPGSSRLRITVSSAHEDEEIERLVDGLGRIRKMMGET